jgi:hypothetical protein
VAFKATFVLLTLLVASQVESSRTCGGAETPGTQHVQFKVTVPLTVVLMQLHDELVRLRLLLTLFTVPFQNWQLEQFQYHCLVVALVELMHLHEA